MQILSYDQIQDITVIFLQITSIGFAIFWHLKGLFNFLFITFSSMDHFFQKLSLLLRLTVNKPNAQSKPLKNHCKYQEKIYFLL